MSYVLWLASWYPNQADRYNGDFVQRHAMAAALYRDVTVVHVHQLIPRSRTTAQHLVTQTGRLTEHEIIPPFRPTGLGLVDRIRFNFAYHRAYRRFIKTYLQHSGRPDLVHVHVPMKAGMVARWIRRNMKIPYVVSEHSTHYLDHTNDPFSERSLYHRNAVAGIMKDALAVTNVSTLMASVVERLFHLRRTIVIHNTVDTGLFNFSGLSTNPRPFRFIHVSTLDEQQKRPADIIAAFNQLLETGRRAELVMVGPAGSESHRFDQVTSEFIRFTGELPYAGVASELKNADAFILFSEFENFPCVLIEALCCGLPLIATDTGGVQEIITRDNGILISKGDKGQLLAAMIAMMDKYRSFDREAIAADARGRYSYEHIGEEFEKLYIEVMARFQGA